MFKRRDPECERRPVTSAASGHQNLTPGKSTPPQARGLRRQLEVAEARVAAAPDWQTAREARRATNLLRKQLRPAPGQETQSLLLVRARRPFPHGDLRRLQRSSLLPVLLEMSEASR